MPTKDEVNELLRNCKFDGMELNGVKGCKVIGKNGNYIFIPVAGWKAEQETNDITLGYYWISTNGYYDNPFCLILYGNDSGGYCSSNEFHMPIYGYSIRAVSK